MVSEVKYCNKGLNITNTFSLFVTNSYKFKHLICHMCQWTFNCCFEYMMQVNNKVIVQICGTLLYNYLPDVTGHFDLCSSGSRGITQNFSLPSTVNPSFYVPYPKVGLWHIMLQVTCFDGTGYVTVTFSEFLSV